MGVTHAGPIVGRSCRRGGRWTVVFVVLVGASLVVYRTRTGLAATVFVGVGATAVASVVASMQAYRNGSVALSWLLASAPAVAFAILTVEWWFPDGSFPVWLHLNAGLFIGLTAHLLGVELAESRGVAPRPRRRVERYAVLGLLAVSGTIFAATVAVPRLF